MTPLPGCPAGLPLPGSSPLRRRVVSVDCGAGLGCEGDCFVRSLPDTSSLAVRAWLRFSRIPRSFSSSRCHRGGVMPSNRQPRALGTGPTMQQGALSQAKGTADTDTWAHSHERQGAGTLRKSIWISRCERVTRMASRSLWLQQMHRERVRE